MTDDSTVSKRTKPLQQGVVLAGRYRLRTVIGEAEGARLYEASDLQLADRRTIVAEVAGEERDLLARTWLSADSPWTAALLDVVSIAGRVCAVFDLDDDAASLSRVAGVSREQRASLIVDVARVIDRTAAAGLPVRLLTDHTLWVEGLPAEGRLRAIPIPIPGRPVGESTAADLAALARLTAQQLFGIDPTVAPQTALARLPDAIQAVLEPLYADAPDERLAAGARPDVLLAVLGLSHGASRVPVPVVSGPPPTFGTQLTAAANHARRKSIRELGGAVAFLLFILAFVAPLGAGSVAPATGLVSPLPVPVPVSEPVLQAPSMISAVPAPTVRTHPAADHLHPVRTAVVYHSVRNDGPVPEGHFRLSGLEEVSAYRKHARVFLAENRIVRVERFDPRSRLVTTTTYTYDGDGRVASESVYFSTGALLSSGTFSYERGGSRGVYEGRHHTGAPSPRGCASIRFVLDDDGRYLSRRCFDIADDRALFHGGHHEERFQYEGSAITQTFWSGRGNPVQLYDGYFGTRETIDDEGRVAVREYLGRDGELVRDRSVGAARVEFTWQTGGVATERLFDEESQPTLGARGWHRAVEFRRRTGELSSYATYDTSYQPVPQGLTGVARIIYTADANGLVQEEAYYDVGGAPVIDANGVHRIEFIRDTHDNILRECHFDLHSLVNSPILDEVSCVVSEQDEFGFVASERFYGADGSPVTDSRAMVHGVDLERDALNRVTRRGYVAVNGSAGATWAGYHAIEYSYDEWGRFTEYRYRTHDGQPARTTTEVTTVRTQYDTANREVRRCFFGHSGDPVAMATGFGSNAHCFSWVYVGDQLDEIAYTDVGDRAVNAEFDSSAHRGAYLHFEWGDSGSLLTQEYYDESRTLIETKNCLSPLTCIAVDGWSWHVP